MIHESALPIPFGFQNKDTSQAAEGLDLLTGSALQRRAITDADIRGQWTIPRYDANDCFDRLTNECIPLNFLSSSE